MSQHGREINTGNLKNSMRVNYSEYGVEEVFTYYLVRQAMHFELTTWVHTSSTTKRWEQHIATLTFQVYEIAFSCGSTSAFHGSVSILSTNLR